MQGKKISNEVSPQEMLRMRNEEHLSNAEIADRLDICRDTVIRYIGKQPGWMGRKKRLPGIKGAQNCVCIKLMDDVPPDVDPVTGYVVVEEQENMWVSA